MFEGIVYRFVFHIFKLFADTNDDEYWQHYENLNARYDKNFAKGVCAVEKMPGISVFTHGQCCKSGYQSTWS